MSLKLQQCQHGTKRRAGACHAGCGEQKLPRTQPYSYVKHGDPQFVNTCGCAKAGLQTCVQGATSRDCHAHSQAAMSKHSKQPQNVNVADRGSQALRLASKMRRAETATHQAKQSESTYTSKHKMFSMFDIKQKQAWRVQLDAASREPATQPPPAVRRADNNQAVLQQHQSHIKFQANPTCCGLQYGSISIDKTEKQSQTRNF